MRPQQNRRIKFYKLHSIIEDLFALVETHMPEFDTLPYREKVRQRRAVWDQPPGNRLLVALIPILKNP